MKLLPPDPWERRLDESADEYQLFQAWIQKEDRGIPAQQDLATQMNWSGRALAWERSRVLEQSPKELLKYNWTMLAGAVTLENQKLLTEIKSSHAMVLSHRDLLAYLRLLAELPGAEDEERDYDLSRVTDADLKDLERISKSIRQTG